MATDDSGTKSGRLDRVVAEALRERQRRERGYREQALKLLPWICARCGREFTPKTVRQLTVHHTDHNHDHNPPDGSNWELLCIYCHENEHARFLDHDAAVKAGAVDAARQAGTYQPFADLRARLREKGNQHDG
ncbi:MAG TPA: YajD family HNH nuclease [Burkholderiales bacterium]|nr:YajD family HNH nuclease [Burkholderiales bacterium]